MLSIKFNFLTSWTDFLTTSTGAPPSTPCQVPTGPVYGSFTVPSGDAYGVYTVVSGPAYGAFTVPASPSYGCST
jgi:hypothetical protein